MVVGRHQSAAALMQPENVSKIFTTERHIPPLGRFAGVSDWPGPPRSFHATTGYARLRCEYRPDSHTPTRYEIIGSVSGPSHDDGPDRRASQTVWAVVLTSYRGRERVFRRDRYAVDLQPVHVA